MVNRGIVGESMEDELTDDLFEGYQRKNFTAEDVFKLIDNQSVSKEKGIQLIENYGIGKARDAIEELRKASGIKYDPRITELIDRINKHLDELLQGAVENITKGEKNYGK